MHASAGGVCAALCMFIVIQDDGGFHGHFAGRAALLVAGPTPDAARADPAARQVMREVLIGALVMSLGALRRRLGSAQSRIEDRPRSQL